MQPVQTNKLRRSVTAATNVARLIFRAGLVYWSVRKFVYWFVADVYYAMLAPLNRVAANMPEKLSVLAFVARWTLVVHRLLPKRFLSRVRGDTTIRLQGSRYAVGLESDEVSIFTEFTSNGCMTACPTLYQGQVGRLSTPRQCRPLRDPTSAPRRRRVCL